MRYLSARYGYYIQDIIHPKQVYQYIILGLMMYIGTAAIYYGMPAAIGTAAIYYGRGQLLQISSCDDSSMRASY